MSITSGNMANEQDKVLSSETMVAPITPSLQKLEEGQADAVDEMDKVGA